MGKLGDVCCYDQQLRLRPGTSSRAVDDFGDAGCGNGPDHSDGNGTQPGEDIGFAQHPVDIVGIEGSIHSNRYVRGRQHEGRHEQRDMEILEYGRCDDLGCRAGDGGSGGICKHHGDVVKSERLNNADRCGADASEHCSHSSEQLDCSGNH